MPVTRFMAAAALILLTPLGHAAKDLETEARTTAMMLGKSLKTELVRSMKTVGPQGAVSFCNQRAPEITNNVSAKTGWHVGRTSLKYRNPGNAPDTWEQAVLRDFDARKADGEPVKTLEYGEVVTIDGRKVYRYMKAIPTGKPCLNCHGAEVKPGVEAILKSLYPDDRARGFKLGDIRGAFTLSKDL